MKKITLFLIIMSLLLCLAACGDAKTEENSEKDPEIAEQGDATEEAVEEDAAEELPTFEEICEKNTAEALMERFGAYRYMHESYGEPDGDNTVYTAGGVFSEEHIYEDWASDEYKTGYVFYNGSSVYRNYDGETFAVLDVSDSYRPDENFLWYASEFYGYDPETVETIEKIDEGYRITFKGDAETAEFFAENYQEGDLFVVIEYVDEDLLFTKCEQIMCYADGREEILNSTELLPCELPEIGRELAELANAEDSVKATLVIDHGCGYTESREITLAKDSALHVETNHFRLFADEAHTTPIDSFDSSQDIVLYALSPIADYISKEDFLNGSIGRTEISACDANGEEIARDVRFFTDNEPSGFSTFGDLEDDRIAYIEFAVSDGDDQEISRVRFEKE